MAPGFPASWRARDEWWPVRGRHGWPARDVKEVSADEITRRVVQEIYDESGKLIETHPKNPADTGHQKIEP